VSTPRFIANRQSYADPWKQQKIDDMVLMLRGAMAAEGKVGLMMNVPRDRLPQVLALLPALQQPTVSSLADERWVDVNTVFDECVVRNIIPRLKAAGARGIVEYALNKVIE
jgi:ATP phosphoribosyltransferase